MSEKIFNTQLPVFGNGEEHKHIGSVVQNDVAANKFVITLLDRRGKPFDMSDVTSVTFTVLRPDGQIEVDSSIFHDNSSSSETPAAPVAPGTPTVPSAPDAPITPQEIGVQEGNIEIDKDTSIVTIIPPSSVLSVAGECFATIELFDKQKHRVSTARICFSVVSDLGTGYDFKLDPRYPVLTNLIYACQVVLEAKEEYEDAKESVEDSVRLAGESALSAKTAKEAAEAASESASSSASTANSAKTAAAEFASDCETFKDSAAASASAASTAASTAQTAANAAEEFAEATKESKDDANNAKIYMNEAKKYMDEAKALRDEAREIIYISESVKTTLFAKSWLSTKVYTFEKDYPHDKFDIKITPADTCTIQQFDAFGSAKMVGSVDRNVYTALGSVPTIDIPIILTKVVK